MKQSSRKRIRNHYGVDPSQSTLSERARELLQLTRADIRRMPHEEVQELVYQLQSELKLSEEEHRQTINHNLELYADLFEFAPIGYITLDELGRIKEVNLTFCRMCGRPRSDLIGTPFDKLLLPEFQDAWRCHWLNLREDKLKSSSNVKIARPNGPVLDILLESILTEEEGVFYCLTALVDITEQKKLEALQVGILNSIGAHVAILDPAGMIVAVNAAWEQFARDNGAEELGKVGVGVNYLQVCADAQGPLSGEASPALAGVRGVLNGWLGDFQLEYPCHGPAGPRWFLMHVTPLRSPGAGAVVSHICITERKRLEQDAVAASEEEKSRVSADLHDGLASLLAGIAYDLSAFTRRLRMDGHSGAEHGQRIGGQISEAIRQTRTLAKGLLPVDPDPVALNFALERLVESTHIGWTGKWDFKLPRVLVPFNDSFRINNLYRIAQEAVRNAVRHSHGTEIELSLAVGPSDVVLRVIDNGIGFEPAVVRQGSVGLRLMEYRVRSMSGHVTISRRPEGGTEILCTIPIQPPL